MLRRIQKLATPEGLRTARRYLDIQGRAAVKRAAASPPARLYAAAVAAARRLRLRQNVQHLWGPAPTPCAPDEAAVVCLVRNGAPYLHSFLQHYTALGARQIVLLDNGSEDGTVELARRAGHDHVTVLSSRLPYRGYQFLFKEYLLTHFGRGGWRLQVDVDELFDYPRSAELPLAGLLAYLNAGGYSAMVAYLLDMFAEGPLLARHSTPDDDLRAIYTYYDISNIRTRSYAEVYGDANAVSNPDLRLYWGGIRNTLFGSSDWLTKHPLLRLEPGVQLRGNVSHDIYGARIADISGVLYHYKFLDRLVDQAARAVREKNYYRGSLQYRRYMKVLGEQPNLQIRGDTARRLESADALVREGFLAETSAYAAWAAGTSPSTARIERRRAEEGPGGTGLLSGGARGPA